MSSSTGSEARDPIPGRAESASAGVVRPESFTEFAQLKPAHGDGVHVWRARGQNFLVEWFECDPGGRFAFGGDTESIVIVPEQVAEIAGPDGVTRVGARSLAILPAGRIEIVVPAGGTVVGLSSGRDRERAALAANAETYAEPDPMVASIGPPFRRVAGKGVVVFEMDEVAPPADRPRLRMLQSDTMSINWIEYDGPRDRSRLTPHSHADFEQGSLAVTGRFVHHLRTPWSTDAGLWRDDRHLEAPAKSLLVIPPGMVHTSAGSGEGRHLLIDVFAPPRRDFIARGWIANAADYTE